MDSAGLLVLAEGDDAGVHLATSKAGFRFVFFQGHPEYDNNSLLKEYKRDVILYAVGKTNVYPPFPDNYFSKNDQKKCATTGLRTVLVRCLPYGPKHWQQGKDERHVAGQRTIGPQNELRLEEEAEQS